MNAPELSVNQQVPITLASTSVPAISQPDSLVSELLCQVNTVAIQIRTGSKTSGEKSGDLGIAEQAVLEIISRAGAVTVPEIARQRLTSRQNIQILVDRLQAEGRVELVHNPAHKRSALVRLTDNGKRWLRATEPNRQRLLSEIGARLSEVELEATLSALRKVVSLLSSRTGAPPGSANEYFSKDQDIVRAPAKAPAVEEPGDIPAEFPLNLL